MTTIAPLQRLHAYEPFDDLDIDQCMHCGLVRVNALHMPSQRPDLPDQTRLGNRYASWEDIDARGRALAFDPGNGSFDEKLTTQVAQLLEPLTPESIGIFMYQRPTVYWGYYDQYMVRHAEEQKPKRIVSNYPPNDAAHWDTAALVVSNPERYHHVYGYARGGPPDSKDTWVLHSWAYDNVLDTIIELTGTRRLQYVGAHLPPRMAFDFGIDIGAYTEEQRTRLLTTKHGGRV